jgi:CheY-like chemotaxis protein
MILEGNGYSMLAASSAEEAFARFQENRAAVDLLIADVCLPSTSGIRVALQLRSRLPKLRVIISSGYPSSLWNEQDCAELDELSSDSVAVMQKPFTRAALLTAVGRLIGGPMQRQSCLPNLKDLIARGHYFSVS